MNEPTPRPEETHTAVGHHYIVEGSLCDAEVISDLDLIRELLVQAAHEANMKVCSSSFHHFPPKGISGVVVISESHLAIHTWPETGYVALDIFTCGSKALPESAVTHILKGVKAQSAHITEVTRGLNDGDGLIYHSIITWEEKRRA